VARKTKICRSSLLVYTLYKPQVAAVN